MVCISVDRHLHVCLCQTVPCTFSSQMSKLLGGKVRGNEGFRSLLPLNIQIFFNSFTQTLKNIFSFFNHRSSNVLCLVSLAHSAKSFPSSCLSHVWVVVTDLNSSGNGERVVNKGRELSCRALPTNAVHCAWKQIMQKACCQPASHWICRRGEDCL